MNPTTIIYTPPLIIGFGARSGVGKDLACRFALNLFTDSVRVAFADELKADLAIRFADLPIDPLTHDRTHKDQIRSLLVGFGMCMRNIDPDYWIKKAFAKIDAFTPEDGVRLVVVSDTRFENEVRAIQARGGVYVHIDNPLVPAANEEENFHAPRCAALADYTIENIFDIATRREADQGHFHRSIKAIVCKVLETRGLVSPHHPGLTGVDHEGYDLDLSLPPEKYNETPSLLLEQLLPAQR